MTDECSQDWTLLSAETREDGLVFEVERSLDTGDVQDRIFTDDTVEGEIVYALLLPLWSVARQAGGACFPFFLGPLPSLSLLGPQSRFGDKLLEI